MDRLSDNNLERDEIDEQIRQLVLKAVDRVNDAAHSIPEVEELKSLVLKSQIGRDYAIPRGDDDDDPEYWSAVSEFYTKLFLKCADGQWFWDHGLREQLMKKPLAA